MWLYGYVECGCVAMWLSGCVGVCGRVSILNFGRIPWSINKGKIRAGWRRRGGADATPKV